MSDKPHVKVILRTENEAIGAYKGCDIHVSREDGSRNWYIHVTDSGGFSLYHGYWRDSAHKTLDEALTEACIGSLLWRAEGADTTEKT